MAFAIRRRMTLLCLWIAVTCAIRVPWQHETVLRNMQCDVEQGGSSRTTTSSAQMGEQQQFLIELHSPNRFDGSASSHIQRILRTEGRGHAYVSDHARGVLRVHFLSDPSSNVSSVWPSTVWRFARRICHWAPRFRAESDLFDPLSQSSDAVSGTSMNANGRDDGAATFQTGCVKALLFPPIKTRAAQQQIENFTAINGVTVSFRWPSAHPVIAAGVDHSVTVCVPRVHRHTLVDRLVRNARVYHVEQPRTARPLNLWTRGWLQSGAPRVEPFAGAGIYGKGSVVGIADTGIDHDHCFFRDPDHPLQLNVLNRASRKIIRYASYSPGTMGAFSDFLPGHGTHVAGSVAGVPLTQCPISDYHGVATGAKITFTDLAETEEQLYLPDDLEPMFKLALDDGAFVHSNSWGMSKSDYPSAAVEVDRTMQHHPAMLLIFAAGNSADSVCTNKPSDLRCGGFTVLAPSTAKNCLSIGASMAVAESWAVAGYGNFIAFLEEGTFRPVANTRLATSGFSIVRGEFGPRPDWSHAKLILPPESNAETCSALLDPRYRGRIVVSKRGTCKFAIKAQNADTAGAVGLIVINNIPGDAVIMGNDGNRPPPVHLPCVMISDADGAELLRYLAQSPDLEIYATSDMRPNPHKNPEDLSGFSSRGPTRDMRYKPELLAVGELVHSSRSDANTATNNCDTWPSQGTSMATPLVAGTAVLVREYFSRGFHPTGVERNNDRVELLGDGLKAVLLHAARPLHGLFDRNSQGDWMQLSPHVPTFEQGHGLLQINLTLPIGDSSDVRLFFRQNDSVSTGEHKMYCVRYVPVPRVSFRAVLVWTDPPAAPDVLYTLINDLDIMVIPPHGKPYFGNRHESGGDAATAADNVNNVEKITIDDARAGLYRVVITGSSTHNSQRFSLAVSGEPAAKGECKSLCSERCSEHGKCDANLGLCNCDPGWSGVDCATAPRTLAPGLNVTSELDPMGAHLYRVSTTQQKAGTTLKVHFQSINVAGDPNLYVGRNFVPDAFGRPGKGDTASITSCDNCNTFDGGPLPLASTLDLPVDGSDYFVVVSALCCARAAYLLRLSSDTPASSIAAPFITSASPTQGNSLVSPSLLPHEIVVEGRFATTATLRGPNDTVVLVGSWNISDPQQAPCTTVFINTTHIRCFLSAASISTLCSDASATLVLSVMIRQGTNTARLPESLSRIRCREASSSALPLRTPLGTVVSRVKASLVQLTQEDLLRCPTDSAVWFSTTADLSRCLEENIFAMNISRSALVPTMLLPYGTVVGRMWGEPLVLRFQDLSSVGIALPENDLATTSLLPAALDAFVVDAESSSWIKCRQVHARGRFVVVVVGGDDVPVGKDLLLVVTWADARGRIRAVSDSSIRLRVLDRPSGFFLSPRMSDEGPLELGYPLLPPEARKQTLPVALHGELVFPPDSMLAGISPTMVNVRTTARLQAIVPFSGNFETLLSAVVTSSPDGSAILGLFAPSSLPCGTPFKIALDAVSAQLLYGTVLDSGDDVVMISCHSTARSIDSHSLISHHVFIKDLTEVIRVQGSFASSPTGPAELRPLEQGVVAPPLAMEVIQHGIRSVVLKISDSSRKNIKTGALYLLSIPMHSEGPNFDVNVSTDPFSGRTWPLTAQFVTDVNVSIQRFSSGSQVTSPGGVVMLAGTSSGPPTATLSGSGFPRPLKDLCALLAVELQCAAEGAERQMIYPCPVNASTETSVTFVVHPLACGQCRVLQQLRVCGQSSPLLSSHLSQVLAIERGCENVPRPSAGRSLAAVVIIGRTSRVSMKNYAYAWPVRSVTILGLTSFHAAEVQDTACASLAVENADATLASTYPRLFVAGSGTLSDSKTEVSIETHTWFSRLVEEAKLNGVVQDVGSALLAVSTQLLVCGASPLFPLAMEVTRFESSLVRSFAWDDYVFLQPEHLYDADDSIPLLEVKVGAPRLRFVVTKPLSRGLNVSWFVWLVPVTAQLDIDRSKGRIRSRSIPKLTTTCTSSPNQHFVGVTVADDSGLLDLHSDSSLDSLLVHSHDNMLLLCLSAISHTTPFDASLAEPIAREKAVAFAAASVFGCASSADCGGGGNCSSAKQCVCPSFLRGLRCEISCPESHNLVCSGHGTCDGTGRCLCTLGYAGAACGSSIMGLSISNTHPADAAIFSLAFPTSYNNQHSTTNNDEGGWQLVRLQGGVSFSLAVSLAPPSSTYEQPMGWIDIFTWCDATSVGQPVLANAHLKAFTAAAPVRFLVNPCAGSGCEIPSPSSALMDQEKVQSAVCIGFFFAPAPPVPMANRTAQVIVHAEATLETITALPATPPLHCGSLCRTVHVVVFCCCLSVGGLFALLVLKHL